MNFDKFLRYTIPGLVALIIFYLLASLTGSENTEKIKDFEVSLGFIAGLIFVTGGLGSIFNIIYWAIFHFVYYPLDHTKLLKSLQSKLRIVDTNGNIIESFTKREAWSIFNTYWYSKTNLRTKFEAINPRVDRLSDVTHGLGTTLIGIILTFIFWCFIYLDFSSDWILPSSIGLLLIILNFSNYLFSLKIYQNLLNTTFATILNEDLYKINNKDSSKNEIVITFVK